VVALSWKGGEGAGWTFSSPNSPQDALGRVGGHRELAGGMDLFQPRFLYKALGGVGGHLYSVAGI
jgi:hypothetical protein